MHLPRLRSRGSVALAPRRAKPRRRFWDGRFRTKKMAGLALLFLNVVTGLVYIAWVVFQLNLQVWYLTIPFVAAEMLSLGAVTFFARNCLQTS